MAVFWSLGYILFAYLAYSSFLNRGIHFYFPRFSHPALPVPEINSPQLNSQLNFVFFSFC